MFFRSFLGFGVNFPPKNGLRLRLRGYQRHYPYLRMILEEAVIFLLPSKSCPTLIVASPILFLVPFSL